MKSFETFKDIKSIQILISSPDEILQRSHGEVTNSKSINYKTMQAERGGLFCEVIFGPMKEYECRCGSIEGAEYLGKKCNICGVEVNTPRIRRYRMGHIKLSTSVPHVWFLKIRPFYLLSLMGMRMRDLDNLLLSKSELVSTIRPRSVKDSSSHSRRYRILLGKKTYLGSGCEIVHNYLANLDLTYEYLYQRSVILSLVQNDRLRKKETSHGSYFNFLNSQYFLAQLKRLRILEYFLCSKKRPEWMFIQNIPVLPPELRPFLLMENNLVVSSDLNFLYKRIMERNSRLKTLSKLRESESQYALSSFYFNELSMLEHAVDSLIENGRRGKAMMSRKQAPLKSLTHILKGKEGRFRMNLLGKRVDLSGRTVISVGPRLKLTQCGLPISIALVLFKSLIFEKITQSSLISKKILSNLLSNLRTKSKYSITDSGFVEYIHSSHILHEIENISSSNPLLLNRAPTLHKLNIQSFQPIIINTKAIQLHPLVCSSFNADFDGDQMAIHLPLSLSSQIEARILMMTYNNIINSASGSAIISPTQDVIFGIYYSTQIDRSTSTLKTFFNINDVRSAYLNKIIGLNTIIKFFIKSNNKVELLTTTPGRVFLYSLIPSNIVKFDVVNKHFTKKVIQDLIQLVYINTHYEDFLYFLDNLMAYGFYYAHSSGISLSLEDVSVPSLKPFLLRRAIAKYHNYAANKDHSSLTVSFKNHNKLEHTKQKMVSEWFKAQENLTSLILKDVHESNSESSSPPIYMLIHSGARGSILQMRQLSGIRGLMVKPSGDLIEMPIGANFKEGLNVLEYFYSTHGARKGVIDTSIRTATSGYLTRRLVHATQDLIISEEDCGSKRYIIIRPEFVGGKENRSLSSIVLGRTSAENIHDFQNLNMLIASNKLIEARDILKLSKVEEIRVRSPLTCESREGICKACYGSNLSTNNLVSIGEAVGILSAQSIGEPGTQLTMRTFHMGGVLLGGQSVNTIRSKHSGRVFIRYGIILPLIRDTSLYNAQMTLSEATELMILSQDDSIIYRHTIPVGSLLYVRDGDYISKNDILFKWNPYYEPIVHKSISEYRVHYTQNNLKEKKFNQLILCPINDSRLTQKVIEIRKDNRIELSNTYFYNQKDIVTKQDGDKVQLGDVVLLSPRSQESSGDITGGLSKISQLFECSFSNRQKVLSRKNNWYTLKPSVFSNGIKWNIMPLDYNNKEIVSYSNLSSVRLRSAAFLKKGESFACLPSSLIEILEIYGSAKAISYLKNQILSIYQANGVNIHDKHIELILKRMFGKIEILEKGATPYVISEIVDLKEFISQNLLSLSKALPLAKGKVSVRGVTSISLDSRSFLSAASFQNTAQVLTTSAIIGRTDNLTGLGENVILGRLAPIGSASFYR